MATVVKTKDIKPEPVAYSEAALRNNGAVIEYCRTSMAALSGSTAGVLGLTSLHGFIFYIISVVALFIMFMIKTGPRWHKYHISRQALLTNSFFASLCTPHTKDQIRRPILGPFEIITLRDDPEGRNVY